MRNGSNPVQVAAGRQDRRRAHHVSARCRPDEAAVEGAQDGRDLVVARQQRIGLEQFAEHVQRGVRARQARQRGRRLRRPAGHERLQRGPLGPHGMRRLGHGQQHVDPLGRRGRLADDVQSVRDQRVFEFEHGGGERADLRGRRVAPGRLGRREVDGGSLRLHEFGEARALLARRRVGVAPAVDRGLEVEQSPVETRLRHRRRQVAHQRGRRATLGDGALGRVVGGVEVDVGQVTDQPLRPVAAREADLLAGHELQRPVRAEMQHGIGPEVLPDPAVEGREGVRRRKALLEEQPHRVALVAEGGLDADEDVSELRPEHEDRRAVGLVPPGGGSPLALDLAQVPLALDVVGRRNADMHIGVGAVPLAVAVDDAAAQLVDARRHVDRVAFAGQRAQRAEQRFEHREEGGRAGVAGIGREVEQHHGDLALRALGAPERDQPVDARRQRLGPLGTGLHVAVVDSGGEGAVALATGAGMPGLVRPSAEHRQAGSTVEFGDRHHDGGLDRQQAAVGRAPLLQRLQLRRVSGEIGHVELGEDLLGRGGVVVGGSAHEARSRSATPARRRWGARPS